MGKGLFALLWIFVSFGHLTAPAAQMPQRAHLSPPQTPGPGFALVDAFGSLRFEQPVQITSPPGDTNRLFIVERKGVIAVVTNLAHPARSIFLDLSHRTVHSYEESGLLGLAFHPGYATNGYFYVYRMADDLILRDQLCRFQVSNADPNVANPSSQQVLISQADTHLHHKGGGLAFGPDGYLYLAIGEGGPWRDTKSEFHQNIDKGFFGAVLRIDVDKRAGNLTPNPGPGGSSHYSIPSDNPWVGATYFQGRAVDPLKVRTELYAIGLRQPWRFSFDEYTGDLILGDVGENRFEEVNHIVPGGNYGWPFFEGTEVHFPGADRDSTIPPIFNYPHGAPGNNLGGAIVGGLVCRNTTIPELEGAYIFGDFISGNIWRLDRHAGNAPVQWIAREMAISSFGYDPRDRSILIANVADGAIRRLIHSTKSDVPQLLSQTGAFSDVAKLEPAPGVIPFEINLPFWSDYALKKRWFALPYTNSVFGFASDQRWHFPDGATWI